MPGLSKKEKRVARRPAEPPIERKSFAWLGWALRILKYPATSYAAILALQLKVIWGMWWYKDLTTGDTLAYFLNGARWFREGTTSFIWSPLYCSFLGELFHVSSDAYVIVILHRLLIVLALSLLVLALMRRLLPPFLGWMAAAWWVVLPIDFNALYEVHLFAVIPLLLAVLAILWRPGAWGRGAALSLLLIDGMLMRNENLAAVALLAVLCMGYEFWRSRNGETEGTWLRGLLAPYGVPMLCAVSLILFFFVHRSPFDSREMVQQKHNLNVCQVFAAGYEQRRHDFNLSPWTECGQLMQRVFGASDMSMAEALRANPSAMFGHFWWNIRMLPDGLEVLLFNFRFGDANPDYADTYRSSLVLIPSLGLCTLAALGGTVFFRERRNWISRWRIRFSPFWGSALEARIWAWITLVSLSLVVGGAILTNRPRPSYMFILGIAIRALAGLCCYLVSRQWPRLKPIGVSVALLLVAAVCGLPSVYVYSPSPRPLLKAYRELKPYEQLFHEPNHLLVSTEYGSELSSYDGKCNCRSKRFDELRAEVTPERNLAQVLDQAGATLILADENILADPLAMEFFRNARQFHWDVLAERHGAGENWEVLHRAR